MTSLRDDATVMSSTSKVSMTPVGTERPEAHSDSSTALRAAHMEGRSAPLHRAKPAGDSGKRGPPSSGESAPGCEGCRLAAANRLRALQELTLMEAALKEDVLAEERRSDELLRRQTEQLCDQSAEAEAAEQEDQRADGRVQTAARHRHTAQEEVCEIESELRRRQDWSRAAFGLLFPAWRPAVQSGGPRWEGPLGERFSAEEVLQQILELKAGCLAVASKSSRQEERLAPGDKPLQVQETQEQVERLDQQLDAVREQLHSANSQVAALQRSVHVFKSSRAIREQEAVLDALDGKVSEAYGWISEENTLIPSLDTLAKLKAMEQQLGSSLHQPHRPPGKTQAAEPLRRFIRRMMGKQEGERRLKLEADRKEEMKKRCLRRSLCQVQRPAGRRLLPRSFLPAVARTETEARREAASGQPDPYALPSTHNTKPSPSEE